MTNILNNPSELIGLKKVTDDGIVITNDQALRIIEVDGVSIGFSPEKKQDALNGFASIMYGLKFPIQIMCTVGDFNSSEYIVEKHIQNKENLKSNLPPFFREKYQEAFKVVNEEYSPKVRKYYIIVGTLESAKKLIKRDIMSYFQTKGRQKIGDSHFMRLKKRTDWIYQSLNDKNLGPRILGRNEILKLYHSCFNPFSQKPLTNTSFASGTKTQKNVLKDFENRNAREVIKEILDKSKQLLESEPLDDLIIKAEKEVKKITPLEYTMRGIVSFLTGNTMDIPLRDKGLLLGDADLIAPEYLRENLLSLEHQDGLFTGISISQIPNELTEFWLDSLFNLGVTTHISMHINPLDKGKAIKALKEEIENYKVRIEQYFSTNVPPPKDIVEQLATANTYLDLIYTNEEVFLYTSIYLGFHTRNEDERNNVLNVIDTALADKKAGYEKTFTLQKETLKSVLPFCSDEIVAKRNITSSGMSMLFPFSPASSDTGKGMFLGINYEHGGIVKYDQFNTTFCDNANIYIEGGSGAGKTLTSQTLVTRFLDWGYGVNIIDVLGNYKTLTQRYNGEYVSFGEGKDDGHINFFQLLPGESVRDKISASRGLFGILIDNLDQEMWSLIEDILSDVMNYNLSQNKHTYLRDILNEANNRLEVTLRTNDTNSRFYKTIVTILTSFIKGTGAWIFEHDTNIDASRPLVNIDISGLINAGGTESNKMQALGAYVTLTYLYSNILYGKQQFIQFVIDEVWVLLQYKEAGNFIKEIAKTVRNKGCGLLISTQNIEDLSSDLGRGVIANCSTKIFLKHDASNLQSLEKVFGKSFNLTKTIKEFLLSCKGNINGVQMLLNMGARNLPIFMPILDGEIIPEYALNTSVVEKNKK